MGVELPIRRAYPRKAEIARAVEAAKAAGITIGSIEMGPDGTIRILAQQQQAVPMDSAYDRWQASRRKE